MACAVELKEPELIVAVVLTVEVLVTTCMLAVEAVLVPVGVVVNVVAVVASLAAKVLVVVAVVCDVLVLAIALHTILAWSPKKGLKVNVWSEQSTHQEQIPSETFCVLKLHGVILARCWQVSRSSTGSQPSGHLLRFVARKLLSGNSGQRRLSQQSEALKGSGSLSCRLLMNRLVVRLIERVVEVLDLFSIDSRVVVALPAMDFEVSLHVAVVDVFVKVILAEIVVAVLDAVVIIVVVEVIVVTVAV